MRFRLFFSRLAGVIGRCRTVRARFSRFFHHGTREPRFLCVSPISFSTRAFGPFVVVQLPVSRLSTFAIFSSPVSCCRPVVGSARFRYCFTSRPRVFDTLTHVNTVFSSRSPFVPPRRLPFSWCILRAFGVRPSAVCWARIRCPLLSRVVPLRRLPVHSYVTRNPGKKYRKFFIYHWCNKQVFVNILLYYLCSFIQS